MRTRREKEAYLHAQLPYGIWVCEDGREVLFNRDYKPIWQRKDAQWSVADPDEWVRWKEQWYFYVSTKKYLRQPLRTRIEHLEGVVADFKCGYNVLPHAGFQSGKTGLWVTWNERKAREAVSA